MEYKIGQVFEINGIWYQFVGDNNKGCGNCVFYRGNSECANPDEDVKCAEWIREDGRYSDSETGLIVSIRLTSSSGIERKIGEIFEYNGKWYQAVKSQGKCVSCDFMVDGHCIIDFSWNGSCFYCHRKDKEDVIFKRLEKVGEPFERNGYMYQEYKAHIYPLLMSGSAKIPTDNGFAVIIKQNKEDMEENNNAKHSNFENIGKNLKPFDLEAAKAGKPVCTRDGRKARIICFDAKGDKPIIALIEYEIDERPCNYFANGRFYSNPNENNDADLMMLPEKKEGWVNVYDADTTFRFVEGMVYNTKDEAIQRAKEEVTNGQREKNEYVDTVKIQWEE